MDRRDVLKRILYPKCKTAIEFQFDSLMANPLLSYITIQDIAQLNKIATSIKYSSKPKEKYAMIDNILAPRGFKKMASGTNRVTYRFLDDYRIVLKVAIDKVGLSDNGNEYRNQFLLKPFVTKCFEVSPCGTVGLFERVVPITSREEFINISEDVFDLINNLIGKYVLEDIGEKYYMNYGLREGFGPVLLDYPYVFELDGRKLICNVPEPLEPKGYCGGEIDYDLGYNNLICTKCGKRYLANDLKSEEKSDKPKIIIKGENVMMKMVLKRGNEVVSKLNSEKPTAVNNIPPKKQYDQMRGKVSRKDNHNKGNHNKNYKPNIQTKDEVTLKARIKGNPNRNKNYDRNAKRKEETLEKNTPKIQVSFEKEVQKPVEEVSNFKVELLSPREDKDFLASVNEIDKDILPEAEVVETPVKKEEMFDECFRATIKGPEIWNIDTNELIGFIVGRPEYSREDEPYFEGEPDSNPSAISSDEYEVDKKVEEAIEEFINEEPVETENEMTESEMEEVIREAMEHVDTEVVGESESFGTNLGDLIRNTNYRGNENYKTEKIVSPVENQFKAKEEKKEVPEIVINPRKQEVQRKANTDDIPIEYL